MRILLKNSSEGERATVDHDSGSRVGISTGVWNPDHLVGSSIALVRSVVRHCSSREQLIL